MLLAAVKNTPLMRPNAIPMTKNVAIICTKTGFSGIFDNLNDNIQEIFVINANSDELKQFNHEMAAHTQRKVPVSEFSEFSSRLDLIPLFFSSNYNYNEDAFCYIPMRKIGYENFFTFIPVFDKPISNYYTNNKEQFEKVYTILNDAESKAVFASRIKTVTSGTVGYLKIADYKEYLHPQVKPEPGDVILDGGVSEYIAQQLDFLKTIGPDGRYFGFEPDPVGFCKAYETMKEEAPYNNHELIPFGLWHKRDKLHFEILGQGTRQTKIKNETTVECEVLSIDEFVESRKLQKVDFIKLDIEGAELNALKGAIKTITRFRPKLAICVYHKPEDLYLLPLFLKEICTDYEFFMGHHQANIHETIFYARPKP